MSNTKLVEDLREEMRRLRQERNDLQDAHDRLSAICMGVRYVLQRRGYGSVLQPGAHLETSIDRLIDLLENARAIERQED